MPESPVFVYGTLRRGGTNHFRMKGADFLNEAKARGRLYRIDWYPGLVLDSTADEIHGEVYQTAAGLLEELDHFEGGAYRRVRTQVLLPDGAELSAWVWEWRGPVDESRRIRSGDWLSPPRSGEP